MREQGAKAEIAVSIVVPYRDTLAHLEACLASISRSCTSVRYETWIVDNGSSAGLGVPDRFRRDAQILSNDRNRGFAAACNQAAVYARGRFLLFLNSDVVLGEKCVDRLIALLDAAPGVAAVAPVERRGLRERASPAREFLGPLTQATALTGFGSKRVPMAVTSDSSADVPWVTGASLLVQTATFRRVGGFDEGYLFYEEDEDLCWRLRRRGYRIAVATDAEIEHEGGASARFNPRWSENALHIGQRRFVKRRFGAAAGALHRGSVTLARLAKLGVARSKRPPGRESVETSVAWLLKEVWKEKPQARTTAD